MAVTFKGLFITHQDVLKALDEFDAEYPNPNDYDRWREKHTYHWAINQKGRFYPPKYILSLATGVDTNDFSGGETTNGPLRRLGFDII